MLENTVEMVALATHTERQATATRNLRLREAEQAAYGRQTSDRRSCREAIAAMLLAAATRLAPRGTPDTIATARIAPSIRASHTM